MDKVLLTEENRQMLHDWCDNNIDLVTNYPYPLKALEVVGILRGTSAKIFREDNKIKFYIVDEGQKNPRIDCEIVGRAAVNCRIAKQQDVKNVTVSQTGFGLILKTYWALMAFMAYAKEEVDVLGNSHEHKMHVCSERKPKKKNNGVTYILSKKKTPASTNRKHGSHSSPQGIFTVRGHFCHYKNGKEVWIEQFQKGTGDKKHKTYKLAN